MRRCIDIVLVVSLLFTYGTRVAQAAKDPMKYLSDEKKLVDEAKKTKHVSGWQPLLNVGANVALASSNNVVGQVDGLSVTLGGKLDGGLSYAKGDHEWRNTLNALIAYSRTPAIDDLIKSNDLLELESIYLYHIRKLPWLGPFARVQLRTAMAPGRDVQANPVTYRIKRTDGLVEDLVDRVDLDLSDAFQPLTLRETAGMFATPVSEKRVKVEFKIGFAAGQTFADGALALDSDVDPTVVEVSELKSAYQGGPAASLDVTGELTENKLTYYAGIETMMPVLNDDTNDRGAGDLLNVYAQAGLSVKLFSWASLDYTFKLVREPQVVDAFQIQNNLLLTFFYAVFPPPA